MQNTVSVVHNPLVWSSFLVQSARRSISSPHSILCDLRVRSTRSSRGCHERVHRLGPEEKKTSREKCSSITLAHTAPPIDFVMVPVQFSRWRIDPFLWSVIYKQLPTANVCLFVLFCPCVSLSDSGLVDRYPRARTYRTHVLGFDYFYFYLGN